MNDYQQISTPIDHIEHNCAASLQNRHSILTNQIKRKSNLAEIKRILSYSVAQLGISMSIQWKDPSKYRGLMLLDLPLQEASLQPLNKPTLNPSTGCAVGLFYNPFKSILLAYRYKYGQYCTLKDYHKKGSVLQIANVDAANQILSLVTEIYMDAEYRQRTNLQMKEIVVKMEREIANLRKTVTQPKTTPFQQQTLNFHEQLKRTQNIMRDLQQKNLKLLSEVAYWQRQGYELRTELANSSVNNQTELLIEQLTLQLQQQKSRAHSMHSKVQFLEQQMLLCQRELTEKTKKIRLLQLQLNRRYI